MLPAGTMSRNQFLAICIIIGLLGLLDKQTLSAHSARCVGDFPCDACKTCDECRYCAEEGGTCGVCAEEPNEEDNSNQTSGNQDQTNLWEGLWNAAMKTLAFLFFWGIANVIYKTSRDFTIEKRNEKPDRFPLWNRIRAPLLSIGIAALLGLWLASTEGKPYTDDDGEYHSGHYVSSQERWEYGLTIFLFLISCIGLGIYKGYKASIASEPADDSED